MAGDPSPEFDAASLLSSQIYNALDDEKQQLRLVGIQPGARDAPIECTLTICDLKLNPKYEALSYEWAFPGSERSIMLSGKMFMVRENLWWALYHLRDETQERVIWIDAICINQDDNWERNHQVGMMSAICRNATLVRVWLGREKDDSRNAFKTLHNIQTFYPSGGPWRSNRSKHLLYIPEHTWRAISRLLYRTYWSRIWIVQELILAQEIILHCGEDEMNWCCFEFFLVELEPARLLVDKIINPRAQVPGYIMDALIKDSPAERLSRRRKLGQSHTLLSLMQDCIDFQASDPRDKIFALLGLASDAKQKIEVDYNKSLEEVKEMVAVDFRGMEKWSGWSRKSLFYRTSKQGFQEFPEFHLIEEFVPSQREYRFEELD